MQEHTGTRCPDKGPSSRGRFIAAGCALIVLVFVAYGPALRAGFIWDDDYYVTANLHLRSLSGLGEIWFRPGATPQYYPLVFTSFWIEYRLWGLSPAGYHAVNVLLHGLAAVLLAAVLGRAGVRGAWLVAAVFALHPVCVESVAWVSERKNVLSGLFYMGSFWCLLRYFGAKEPKQLFWYMAGLLLFVLSLLCKTVTLSLPAALLLVLWYQRGRAPWREALVLAPFFLLGAGFGTVTAWMEVHHIHAAGREWSLTLIEKCLLAGRALWFYAAKVLVPAGNVFFYPRWEISQGIWWQYLYPLGFLCAAGLLWALRGRLSRGPLAALLFFAGTLFPALGFFNVYPFRYSYVADHFQYLACIGIIVLVVEPTTRAVPRQKAAWRRAGALAAAGVLAFLCFQTWHLCRHYKDLETLWVWVLEKNPTAWIAHNNLADIRIKQGRLEEAAALFAEAGRLKPDDAVHETNLGNVLMLQGRLDEALARLAASARKNPSIARTHYLLGMALAKKGALPEAIRSLSNAIALDPAMQKAHANLGALLATMGRLQEAVPCFEKALDLDPDDAAARKNLAFTLSTLGRPREAAAHLEAAARLAPRDALIQDALGIQWMQMGRFDRAAEAFEKALLLQPGFAGARDHLGQARRALGLDESPK